MADRLKESYRRRPNYTNSERPLTQDLQYSITTLDKKWTDPIVEAKQVTFKFSNLGGKTKQSKQKEYSFEIYTSDPKNSDFITELVKNCT